MRGGAADTTRGASPGDDDGFVGYGHGFLQGVVIVFPNSKLCALGIRTS
jgi:hypothetical protein